ncbi:single-stranded-DNA-specific exonuclease RecJ [Paenibacillus radicis (ex Xue et al. 2023)]|uniref:Single-stranded-DNA-specific exonuclease RecJ n=1 Tax=Paenibacillus radicis (ex Xue et al. 2023) TaxID=2972489 RepID=A0ABT1YLM7_9BACL|nr:single-stranded-DNA-specific exonuclease RecJ [Paenibacillus radicis (ex Xue et al. 2023)]MCR8634088.1 single-stranded-DNA-specific exonuclease RecJ [Paenibacillus radicis (ex Xue et al. 2023)]
MLHARARWNTNKADADQVEQFAKELEIEPLLAQLLIVRGITEKEQAAAFLYGGTDRIHDPFLLDGMEKAVNRIRQALKNGEKIRVYGDYDADGVSSTALMVHLLKQLEASFDYYIPHRVLEGYGLNKAALAAAQEQGIHLIITVDTGISAVEEIAYARELGIDVIVTDHHEPPPLLPDAYAVINPKKPGCSYPFKQLAGVGVALKLAQALLGYWPEQLLEYAAIGTVADLMPLLDENRIIVKLGVKQMQSTSNSGIRALLDVAGIKPKDVNATHIGFALAPRINASGRLDKADHAVRLLITDDELEAENVAFDLDQLNKERQRLVEEMTKQAMSMMEEKKAAGIENKVIVLAHEDWNVGVIGIVASKIVDKFYRPTIILGIDKESGLAKGSARSIAGFDLYQALHHCGDLMKHFGGHQAAAGMTLEREHLPELEARLNVLAEEWLTPDDLLPLLQADLTCSLEEIGLKTIQQLEQLGPFGMGNPTPKFVLSNIKCQELRTIGKEHQHIKVTLQQSKAEAAAAATLDAVGFNKGTMIPWISSTATLDVIGELSINEWNGVRKPQMMIQDLRIPHIQLFDWRGASKLEHKLSELADRLSGAHTGEKKSPAILIFHQEGIALMDKFGKLPVWRVDKSVKGGCIALNEQARQQSLESIYDLILYDLPEDLPQLAGALLMAQNVQRVYAVFEGGDRNTGTLPSRDMFKTVYGAVQQQKVQRLPSASFLQVLSKRSGLSPTLIQFMLDVFMELGLINRTEDGYMPAVNTGKKELSLSLLYQRRQNGIEAEQTLLYSSAHELLQWLLDQRKQTIQLLEDII